MSHQAKIVAVSKLAPGLIAVKVRCCDDPSTDSVLTLGGLDREQAELDVAIAAHHKKVETQHALDAQAEEHVKRLISGEDDYRGCCQ